jgi:putative membrane protein
MKQKLPVWLLAAYLVWFSVLAVRPYDRMTWFFENLGIVVIVGFLACAYRAFRFSNLAYLMMSVLIFLHTLGGHYTFERVPFGMVTNLFGMARNNFDRISHFSVGFYAYPIAEYLSRKQLTTSRTVACLFGIFAILGFAALYEIVEWLYAASVDPSAGAAFLGSQGDIWDAQKDMLADGLGALAATAVYALVNRHPAVSQRPTAATE